jgi:manganese transport protein
MTGVATFGILALQRFGFRPMEIVIAGLIGVIAGSYLVEAVMARPDLRQIAIHTVTPQFGGAGGAVLAVGILGATVMPHVIYLHSALTQRRVVGATPEARRRIFRFELVDVIIAMTIAGVVNMAMLITAAAVFHANGFDGVDGIQRASHVLGQVVGGHAQTMFGVALLASGLSSSSVGTLAGPVVMQGFIRRSIPLFVRRGLTMAPAMVVLAIGVNPSKALVLSQVALSFGIPFALVPLVLFCRDKSLMGTLTNRPVTTAAAFAVATVIVCLNVFLLVQTLTGVM